MFGWKSNWCVVFGAGFLCLCWMLLGCGGSGRAVAKKESTPAQADKPAQQSPEQPPPKFDFNAVMARELAPMTKMELGDERGGWKGSVEGIGAPTYQKAADYTAFTVPLGTSSPLICFVYDRVFDAAAAIMTVMKESSANVQFTAAGLTDVQVVGDRAALFAEGLYTAKADGKTVVGLLKLAVASDNRFPVLCIHDEVGYRKTFQRVALEMLRSMQPLSGEQPQPSGYTQISSVSIDDLLIGYVLETIKEEADGSWVHQVTNAQVMARSAAEIVSSDTVKTEYTDKKGLFSKQVWVTSEQGEVKTQITTERTRKNKHRYKGRHASKNVEGTFETRSKTGLSTDLLLYSRIAGIVKQGKAEKIQVQEYAPRADPSRPLDVTYAIRVEDGVGKIDMRTGQLEMAIIADAQGLFDQVRMPIGNRTLIIKRIFSSGAFTGVAVK